MMSPKKTSTTSERKGTIPKAFPLSELYLDYDNPRLGAETKSLKETDQSKILDKIVDNFGVDDLLSSLAVNGYFDAEPIVGIEEAPGRIRIREGNRRLAACLILAGDERARRHEKRTRDFQLLQKNAGKAPITEIPVILHEDNNNLLSYLGVRHIASQLPWDSYAKVAWVAQVVESQTMTVKEVSEMIGDQHKTIPRTLEGYYFVNQLIEKGYFNPKDSMRRGRGSNPDFPFSWIYTALGFQAIREWLGLDDIGDSPSKKPIKDDSQHLEEASNLLRFLFGNKTEKADPTIKDSRQISELARLVGDRESLHLLKKGKTIQDIQHLTKPPSQQVEEGLMNAKDVLQSVLPPLAEGNIQERQAEQLLATSKKVRSLAQEVHKKILVIASGDDTSLEDGEND